MSEARARRADDVREERTVWVGWDRGSSVVSIAEGVRHRRHRAIDVVHWFLQAAREANQELNAFTYVAPAECLEEQARVIDEAIEEGHDPGALAGVPVAVKDTEHVRGMPTSFGSYVDEKVPAADSVHVLRLRRAGAIIVGKTNVPEFAYSYETRNARFGQTRNPRDLTRSPGGSSGGSAAAVSSGMVPLATGSDGGGSIRIPAAFCGLPGLKPTFGLVPGSDTYWGDLGHSGALTRTVQDLARYLDVVTGVGLLAAASRWGQQTSYERALTEPLKVGGLKILASVSPDGMAVDDAVQEAFEHVLRQFERAGVSVTRSDPPLPKSLRAFLDMASRGDALRWQTWSAEERGKVTPSFREWCERGLSVSRADLRRAEETRRDVIRATEAVLEEFHFMVTATVALPAWKTSHTPPDPADVLLTHPFNLSGHPALTLPLPDVLAGFQVIGPYFSEANLLRLACRVLPEIGYAGLMSGT
ncbi:MAG: amidase [Armatimonadota bacterium]|nr:amidase [Armatimonadota bacterium]